MKISLQAFLCFISLGIYAQKNIYESDKFDELSRDS